MNSRIKIIRQYDSPMARIGELTHTNWRKYSEKHDYGLCTRVFDGVMEEANRKKLVAVHDAIAPSFCEFLFWADADTVVTNNDIVLESYIQRMPANIHLIFDVSHYGLSTGNFFARNTLLAKQLLATAITCGDVTPEINQRFASINGHDESTMKLLLESFPFFQRHVTTVKIADFPRTHGPSSFILHASQRSEAERIQLLSPYCV